MYWIFTFDLNSVFWKYVICAKLHLEGDNSVVECEVCGPDKSIFRDVLHLFLCWQEGGFCSMLKHICWVTIITGTNVCMEVPSNSSWLNEKSLNIKTLWGLITIFLCLGCSSAVGSWCGVKRAANYALISDKNVWLGSTQRSSHCKPLAYIVEL